VKIPLATYRLQFNREFRLEDARRLVDYLHELGITDLYASPLLKARAGSTHGYDVTDPTQLNPELGSAQDLDNLSDALRSHDMGLILDIVPNHMAASIENPWWRDVLENGEDSSCAPFFDVNWASKKVLLPILRRPYGETLDNHELVIGMEEGRPVLQYHEQRLPLAAGAETLRPELIDQILSRQHYRLAFWRKAVDSMNYRRFFDVHELVGLRTESEEVFRATHAYTLELLEKGTVTGLRIDHIDGLLDPKGYLDRLPPVYVAVEKILAADEKLPGDWQASGTTGYDFLNYVNGVFVDRKGYQKLKTIYAAFTGSSRTYTEVFRERKRQVMSELFSGEVNDFVKRLSALAEQDRHARDLPAEELRNALVEFVACLPVYRTTLRDFEISPADSAVIRESIAAAGGGPAFDFLARVLRIDPPWYLQNRKSDYLDFVMHLQQFTGAIMAKGLEDTAFYIHNPLVSLNEVGGDSHGPEAYFGVKAFHRRNHERRAQWPHSMNATSTHDTKRSEDVRARINVLSEMPQKWDRALHRWARWNPSETAPDANEQILIYQTMLGAWPIEAERLKDYVRKALREGKTHSSWIDVNGDYERQVLEFVDGLYSNEKFLRSFAKLQIEIDWYGALSSLSQLILKMTSPGVPDFYQGTEVWNYSLADPDNRRPVDYASSLGMFDRLKQVSDSAELLRDWFDGRIKLYLTWKGLNFRRSKAALFSNGEYIPLRVTGPRRRHVIAFARRLGDDWCVVAVPRLFAKLGRNPVWKNTAVELPEGAPTLWKNVFTNEPLSAPLLAENLFATLPFALLEVRAK
jgi:(1->4)-alpha-D-glucan 1-alpha-D-glucosylmutase